MTDQRYVFLIGAARSGTKFLRDTLAASSDVAEVPYDINYVWRHGNENCPHDELTASDIDDKTAAHIRKSVTRLAAKNSSGPAKVILEKTVSNTLRMNLIRRVFPEAEFIYLERSGFDAVESSYRQWTTPADRSYLIEKLRYFPVREWRYGFWFAKNMLARSEQLPVWGPRYDGIDDDLASLGTAQTCAHQWKHSVEHARASVLPTDTITIRYEDLDDKDHGLTQLLVDLKLGDSEIVLRRFKQHFQKVSSWPGKLPSGEIEAVREVIGSAERPRD